MLDYIALGMVLHKSKTGYEIKKEIEMGVGNFYKASYGSLYPALKKLADKGYLTMIEQANGNRNRKFYLATEFGKSSFIEWLSSPLDINTSSDSLLARIYFFGELTKDTRNSLIKEYELYANQILRKLQVLEKQANGNIENDRDYFKLSTLYLGLQEMYTAIRWLSHIGQEKPLKSFIKKYGK